MRIGVPRETRIMEGRVALVPAAAGDLVRRGHEVWVERGAGLASGFDDAQYERLGVRIAGDAAEAYARGELIVKVKEPVEGDLALLRPGHLLFCYLHLAPDPPLARRLLEIGLTAVAFETVELDDGTLPLLAPMSVIAGRIAVQVGTHYLHQPLGGKGVLLGGLPATPRGKVVVLGAGQAGGGGRRRARGGVREARRPPRCDDPAGPQRHRPVSLRGPGGARSGRGRPGGGRGAGDRRGRTARGQSGDGPGHGARQRDGGHR